MKKTGFIAIVGRPNVGKSTLLNALLGEKVAIVSKKPQTTRNRITGILTKEDEQFVFLDTPGMHRSKNRLGDYMVKAASGAMTDVDGVILVVEAGSKPGNVEIAIIERLKSQKTPIILAVNKSDITKPEYIGRTIEQYALLYDFMSVVPVSAMKNDGVDIILNEARAFLREGEWLFDSDALTDQPERQIAAEIIREKLLRVLEDEIPHGTAVVIEEFEESSRILKIRADIFCERQSHKGIIIGKYGQTLKTVGRYAREDLEAVFETKVYLNLWVKVKEKWRDNEFFLNNFGYHNKDE